MFNRLARYTLVGLNLLLGLNVVCGAVWVVPGLPREWLAGTRGMTSRLRLVMPSAPTRRS
jgi:hypothetical protein